MHPCHQVQASALAPITGHGRGLLQACMPKAPICGVLIAHTWEQTCGKIELLQDHGSRKTTSYAFTKCSYISNVSIGVTSRDPEHTAHLQEEGA
eukprot:1159668-Pelagomonas_calceolata.AAC.5